MKLRACIRMLLALGVVLAAASATGAGKKQVPPPRPFWGAFAGEIHWEQLGGCPTQQGFFTISEAEGQMTHLGRTALYSKHCASADGSQALGGTATFTAANGDEVWATYTAHVTKIEPPLLVEEGEFTITGGTGRFEQASGRLSATVFVTMADFPPTRWPVEFVFAGTISY